MSITTSTGYLVKDVKEELKTKVRVNDYQKLFILGFLITLVMYSFYTYIIIFSKSTIITIICMSILFTWTAYEIHCASRSLKLCDIILYNDKKILIQSKKILKTFKEAIEKCQKKINIAS